MTAQRMNMTSQKLDMTAPRLDMTEVPRIDVTGAALGSDTPPGLDLTDLTSRTTNLSIEEDREEMDPFHPDTHNLLLSKLKKPIRKYHGYIDSSSMKMPTIKSKA